MKLIKKQIKMLSKDTTRLPVLMTANIAGGRRTRGNEIENTEESICTANALASANEIKNSAHSICTA
ncbi:hypothetical protein PRUB_a1430 [Pseudoalteromonas rubra]|uniref:Uncharacterized protein n=1 Tax=Pseudoalteromonas rubra TaxID=43658 RepID=A0A0U3HI64_9GAMM|nr:hypothetical protein [Pseudoalteromonas rubra]ALU42661.1 hypothetical protein AT705_06645 [Pseudoalteromonas rubra]KAF7786773.1 hypothetical protein PRUB_a1430 [Pseudoalteromonas rubra]